MLYVSMHLATSCISCHFLTNIYHVSTLFVISILSQIIYWMFRLCVETINEYLHTHFRCVLMDEIITEYNKVVFRNIKTYYEVEWIWYSMILIFLVN